MQEMQVTSLGQEDPLEKEMATHSSILAWEIPWTEEPGGLQSIGWQRVGHDWATKQQQRECTHRRRESEGITEAEGRVAWPQAKKFEQPPEDNRGKECVVPSSFGGNITLVDLEFLVLEVSPPELWKNKLLLC